MPQALTDIGLPIALILIMIGVGLSLTSADFKRVIEQPKSFVIGALCQMLVLPIVALIIISMTGLTGELAFGLFILALCPGGTTSNMYSYLAKADVGLSVSLTASLGFITPFTIPLLASWSLTFFGGDAQFELPILITWAKLTIVTVIPVLIGMAIRNKWQTFALKAQAFVSWFSITVLALVIISICVKLGEKLIDFTILTGPAVIALNIITMTFGYLVGKLLLNNEPQSRTITLEVGLQNGTLALLITSGILQSNAMSMAPSIYSLFMFITASLFTFIVLKKDKVRAANVA